MDGKKTAWIALAAFLAGAAAWLGVCRKKKQGKEKVSC